jgi:hypothetical protein
MSESDSMIPRDDFSVLRRQLSDNPEAVTASSRIDIADFYGRLETWTIDTFRIAKATGKGDRTSTAQETTAFLQKMTADSSLRLVVPPAVMQILTRHSGSLSSKRRSLGARKALETKRLNGLPIGNIEGLRRARKARKRTAR